MLRRLITLIFQLAVLVLLFVLLTVAWVIVDGLIDSTQKAAVALVSGFEADATDTPELVLDARLDEAVRLYNDSQISVIIVSGRTGRSGNDVAETMERYLEEKGVPASAIIKDRGGEDTHATAVRWAATMKEHDFDSVMLVTHYYQMTRLKLALKLAGISKIEPVHVGRPQKSDAMAVGHEVMALYDFIGHYYLVPLSKKIKDEAKVGEDKVRQEAEKAKGQVNKSLDSLSK